MLILYDAAGSLNCYKVRLFLSLLKLQYQRVPVDLRKGEHRSDQMLLHNPFGQVPVLAAETITLRDSNTILGWLARRYGAPDWLPSEPDDEAVINGWLSAVAFELRLGPYEARLKQRFPAYCVAPEKWICRRILPSAGGSTKRVHSKGTSISYRKGDHAV